MAAMFILILLVTKRSEVRSERWRLLAEMS
jgi:hypothetical protein